MLCYLNSSKFKEIFSFPSKFLGMWKLSIDFKIGMMIPITVRYNVDSVATPKSPQVGCEYVDFV